MHWQLECIVPGHAVTWALTVNFAVHRLALHCFYSPDFPLGRCLLHGEVSLIPVGDTHAIPISPIPAATLTNGFTKRTEQSWLNTGPSETTLLPRPNHHAFHTATRHKQCGGCAATASHEVQH